MRLVYISPLRYPSEKAGSQFSMKSAEVFASAGLDVELWTPRRRNALAAHSPFEFHHVKKIFTLVKLPAIDVGLISLFFFLLLSWSFAISVFWYVLWRGGKDTIYYSHEPFGLFLLTFMRSRTVYEVHDFPKENVFTRWLMRRVRAFVVTNQWKKDRLVERFKVPPDRILAIPNAVDIDFFHCALSKEDARVRLDLPADRVLILYTGQLFQWKGVGTLIEASRLLMGNYHVFVVGGSGEDLEVYQRRFGALRNVTFVGYRPHEEIPLWLKAADVAVLPNTGREEISKYYTSPIKLFEYLAARKVIVVADLPSMRSVVQQDSVYFFKPDDPQDLAERIGEAVDMVELSQSKVEHGWRAVQQYTWVKRAATIINFLKRIFTPFDREGERA